MTDNAFFTVNVRKYIEQGKEGEKLLNRLLADYACPHNPDVERFLHNQAIDFTKRSQSVSYLLFANIDEKLLAYFTLAIKPISVNAANFSNTMRKKIERISEVNEQTGEYILSAYLIAQLAKNFKNGMNERITGENLLQAALDEIYSLRYKAGGTVVFLEADNVPPLLNFYETNGFKQFSVRKRRSGGEETGKLVQLLKVM